MSITKTINAGISGMQANSRGLGIVGGNIANANTVGYKARRANFSEVLAGTSMGVSAGAGARVSSVQQNFGQGDFELTGNPLDMAVSGPGFLVVKGQQNGMDKNFFTRAGQFQLDAEGFVSTPGGLRLQGYGTTAGGEVDRAQFGDLQLGQAKLDPKATGKVGVGLNLDPAAEVPAGPWDPANPGETSNHSTTMTVFDSLGNPIEANLYYRKTGPNTWEYHAMVDGADVAGGTPGQPVEITTGGLAFDTSGKLTAHTPGAVTFEPVGAGAPQPLAFEFEGSTQVAGRSSLKALSQDGWAVGELRDVSIGENGEIVGVFSNGENKVVGQVALADFAAPEGLQSVGGQLWSATPDSGQALMGEPMSGKRGGVVSGALEASNVDMSHEFVKMIAFQRGFQASSKSITTGDQMLSEVVNLKR